MGLKSFPDKVTTMLRKIWEVNMCFGNTKVAKERSDI